MLRGGLKSLEKVLRKACLKIEKRMIIGRRLGSNTIPMRLLFTKKLERIKMLFWKMATKCMMIDFLHPRKNQAL